MIEDSVAGSSNGSPPTGMKRTVAEGDEPSKRVKVDAESSIGPVSEADKVPGKPTEESTEESKKNKNMSRKEYSGWVKSHRGKEKKEKKSRPRRGTRNEEDAAAREAGVEDGEQVTKAPRLPKRQCALLIGFCGTGCCGMQIQPNLRTIEGVLFDAMVKAGAVSQDNADDPVKVNLGRAARTDAGVHAAGNVVSIKMITTVPGVPDIIARINEELPPEIRVWSFVRVQNSFNARLSCDSRKYTYFFPTYLLISSKPGSNLAQVLSQATQSTVPSVVDDTLHPFWSEGDVMTSTVDDDLRRKRQWRIGPEQLEILRATAKKFEGTHNFHNFTVGRDFSDRSNQRHMKKIELSDPAVYGDTEWISVMFHGQSFMLHQRKMMSALILSCRTGTPPQVLDELYGPRTVFIPKMPSLGLLLEHPIFYSYNDKVAGTNKNLEPSDPQYRPAIDFEIHRETIERFKQEHIYNNMRAIEDREGIFDSWIRSLDSYGGNDLLYLNSKGVIPAAAVIKKGERRNNPFREKRRFDATSFPISGEAKDDAPEDEEDEASSMDKKRLMDMEG